MTRNLAVAGLLVLVSGCVPVGVTPATSAPGPTTSQAGPAPSTSPKTSSPPVHLPGRPPPTTSSQPGTTPTSSSTLGPSSLVHWVSPSGNIACIYAGEDVTDGGKLPETVACQIGEHSYARPADAADCQGAGSGDDAISLDVGAPPKWMCASDFWGGPGVAVLAYGASVTNGNIECASENTGMTCRDLTTGHSFMLSRKSWSMS